MEKLLNFAWNTERQRAKLLISTDCFKNIAPLHVKHHMVVEQWNKYESCCFVMGSDNSGYHLIKENYLKLNKLGNFYSLWLSTAINFSDTTMPIIKTIFWSCGFARLSSKSGKSSIASNRRQSLVIISGWMHIQNQ